MAHAVQVTVVRGMGREGWCREREGRERTHTRTHASPVKSQAMLKPDAARSAGEAKRGERREDDGRLEMKPGRRERRAQLQARLVEEDAKA